LIIFQNSVYNLFSDIWSAHGCSIALDDNLPQSASDEEQKSSRRTVVCKCDHLTSFAVLGERVIDERRGGIFHLVLHIVIFVCSFLALVMLGGTTITFFAFR